MNFIKYASLALLTGILSFSLAYAQADPKAARADKVADRAAARAAKGKIPAPFARIASLTEEQKQKLSTIAAKAAADKKSIDERARDDSLAVLTEAQKAELKALQEKAAARRKAQQDAPAK